MAKIVLIYASMSGNTEKMAEAIAKGVEDAGGEIKVMDVMYSASAQELIEYDGVILGSYTWGDGELPDDILDFYEEMAKVNLTGKKAAVFGSGDNGYNYFCAAVDILMEKLKECGADVYSEGLKVDLTPTEYDEEMCRTFGRKFVAFLHASPV